MPPELEDGDQTTVDELKELNLGTKDDLKPVFVCAMLTEEELKQYQEFLYEYRDVFALGYQDMPSPNPKDFVHKLAIF